MTPFCVDAASGVIMRPDEPSHSRLQIPLRYMSVAPTVSEEFAAAFPAVVHLDRTGKSPPCYRPFHVTGRTATSPRGHTAHIECTAAVVRDRAMSCGHETHTVVQRESKRWCLKKTRGFTHYSRVWRVALVLLERPAWLLVALGPRFWLSAMLCCAHHSICCAAK